MAIYASKINPSIYRIAAPYEYGGVVYLYLLWGDRIALVDTGTVSAPSKVLPTALAEIGLTLSDLDLILCTHGHADHTGGNVGVKGASRARILLHAADLPLAHDLATELEFHAAPLRGLEFPESWVRARQDYVALIGGLEKAPVDETVEGGDLVDLGRGISLRVVHAPGHSPGHVVFHWETEGVLLTGDAVQGQGPRPGGYPQYFEAAANRRSLATIRDLGCRMLCTSHAWVGGPISDPTRIGDDAAGLVQESIRVADAIDMAVSGALKRMPGATKRDIALAALAELVYELPQQRVRETEMPATAGPTLFAHIEAVMRGDYPV